MDLAGREKVVRRWLKGIVGGNGGEGEVFVSSHGGVLLQITCIGKRQNLEWLV